MFNITNKTQRLITTHLGDMLPPGVATPVSEVTMENPQMQEWAAAGHIEVVEIQDPPPPETLAGGMARTKTEETKPAVATVNTKA